MTSESIVPCSVIMFCDTAAISDIYTLSLHDALPICDWRGTLAHPHSRAGDRERRVRLRGSTRRQARKRDRKSTRLNSSHTVISYAVFCLKKKISRSTRKTNKRKSKHSAMLRNNERRQ